MCKKNLNNGGLIAILLMTFVLSAPAFAEKKSWREHDDQGYQHNENERRNYQKREHQAEYRRGANVSIHFNDHHRTYIRDYYTEHYHDRRCPSGLYKRHNNCIPPGQERRWRKGYPLPRNVIFYDLPPEIVIQLGPPPEHHRYVRVAADILLIAIGTGIVVDAINDFGR